MDKEIEPALDENIEKEIQEAVDNALYKREKFLQKLLSMVWKCEVCGATNSLLESVCKQCQH